MFGRIKTFFQTLQNAIKVVDRLEQHMILQDRRIKFLEQKQDQQFDDLLKFMNKQKAMDDMEDNKSE